MRILLLSANTGEGHNATARALMEVLESQEITCDLRDALACLSPRFSKYICAWHVRLYKHAPKLFDVGYRAMERTADPEDPTPLYEILRFGTGKLCDILMTGDYDGVICTHPFSAMMMTYLRRSFSMQIPCFFVATDYTCSPTVEQCDVDGYFIPHEELSEEFVRAGLQRERLIPCGIPVRQAFYGKQEKLQARQALALAEDAFVVLLMCGSMGCGPIGRIATELSAQMPGKTAVVAICGNNEKLYESLQELPQLRAVGYTTQVSLYMDAADMIVTKPGGLSATEAANKHLPMVLINTVGGCESRNFDFFLSRGFAVGSTQAEEAVALAIALAQNETARQKMVKGLEWAFHQNSARVITRHVVAAAAKYRQARIESQQAGHPLVEKGGWDMDHQNKVTITNLARSFAGESQARTRYTIYAEVARKEGQEWLARVFEETAANEAVHAEEFLEQLQRIGACCENLEFAAGYPFQLGTTAENLAAAAAGELQEHDRVYPEFAEVARREGFDDAARLWMQIARIEGVHHNVFRQLAQQLESGTLTEKSAPIAWRCLNCGYTYEGIRACDPCPVCGKNAGWQEGQLDKKQTMPKKSAQG